MHTGQARSTRHNEESKPGLKRGKTHEDGSARYSLNIEHI